MSTRIKMVGIDHNKAALEQRELFSFTQAEAVRGMETLKNISEVSGVALLSTCNRTELWLSIDEKEEPGQEASDKAANERDASLLSQVGGDEVSSRVMLCSLKGINPESIEDYFIEREGSAALSHLMELACGLDSQIFGEDQIITQVKEAIELARSCRCADAYLEKIFQMAVTAGKKVRTEVKLTEADPSVALRAVSFAKERYGSLKGLKTLIIGNGQMGVLAAEELLAQGAEVKMTLRKKFHRNEKKDSLSPTGCQMIPYEERVEELSWAQVVISATRSPHYTLKKEEVEDRIGEGGGLWLDLSVPRDIDPSIDGLGSVEVVDIDTLGRTEKGEINVRAIKEAKEIIQEYMGELESWISLRALLPEIQDTIQRSASDIVLRIHAPLEEDLEKDIRRATEKALGKLLFGVNEYLQESVRAQCISALHQASLRNTLKS